MAFSLAQFAFADPHRVIAEDLVHSDDEQRHFCFGEVEAVFAPFVLLIVVVSFDSLVQVTGGKARQLMNAKIKYTDEPLGDIKVVRDFLPPPEQLAFREEGVKVTLALSKKSVEFFKSEAAKHRTQYQRMIRHLVDAYVENYDSAPLTARPAQTARKRVAG